MSEYLEQTIEMTDDGDLVLDSGGDLKLATAKRTLEQNVLFRVKTDFADFYPHPEFGADLGEMIGESNTRKNAEKGQGSIFRVLTQDGLVISGDLKISAIPLNQNKLVYAIFINTAAGELRVAPIILNYDYGIEVIR